MSALMPVLLCWVQCSHECARDVASSGIVAAKMIGFILLGDFCFSGDYMMYGQRTLGSTYLLVMIFEWL